MKPINLVLVDKLLILSTAYVNEVFSLDLQMIRVNWWKTSLWMTGYKKMIPPKTTAETINWIRRAKEGRKEKRQIWGLPLRTKPHRRFIRFHNSWTEKLEFFSLQKLLTVFDEEPKSAREEN